MRRKLLTGASKKWSMTYLKYIGTLLLALGTSTSSAAVANSKTPWVLPEEEDPVPVETQQQIRKLMNEGSAAFAKGDLEKAHAALKKAWEIKPLALTAANLGEVEIKLGRYRDAAEHLQSFLQNAPSNVLDKRAGAEQKLAECRKHIASVEVTANVDGAQVTLDGLDIGHTPLLNQLFLDAGIHALKVTHASYQPETRTFTAEAGSDLELRFKLSGEPPVPVEPARTVQKSSVSPATSERTGSHTRTWVVLGGSAATAISLGIGVALQIRASSLGDDAKFTLAQVDTLSTVSQVSSHGECSSRTGAAQDLCNQLHSTIRRQDSAFNLSIDAIVTAGVLGVATVATYLLWPQETSKPEQKKQARFQVAPWSANKGVGLSAIGGF
jgi:hypothetical protein